MPKYIQRWLQDLMPGSTWNLDDVPSVLLTRGDHWFPDGIHAHISNSGLHWNQQQQFNNADALVEALANAYRGAQRSDLADVVEAWYDVVKNGP